MEKPLSFITQPYFNRKLGSTFEKRLGTNKSINTTKNLVNNLSCDCGRMFRRSETNGKLKKRSGGNVCT